MKRGFLNSKKGMMAMTVGAQAKASPAQPQTPSSNAAETAKLNATVKLLKDLTTLDLPRGEVENAASVSLSGYKPQDMNLPEFPSSRLNYGVHEFICTSMPPENIDNIRTIINDSWTECLMKGTLKRKLLESPGFPQPVPRPPNINYCIKVTPSAGMGMFATHPIHTGDLILAERPLLIVPKGYLAFNNVPFSGCTQAQRAQTNTFEMEKVLRVAVSRMEAKNQTAFFDLANSCNEDTPLLGIINTNCYDTGMILEDSQYGGVCKDMSRINHSCSPNTTQNFNTASFSFQLFAIRDIKEGEEIFYSYCAILDTMANRQKRLAGYGFTCACGSCTGDIVKSNQIRTKFAVREKAINSEYWRLSRNTSHIQPGEVECLLKLALDLLEDVENEGLMETGAYGCLLGDIRCIYISMQADEKAEEFKARQALWMKAMYPGES